MNNIAEKLAFKDFSEKYLEYRRLKSHRKHQQSSPGWHREQALQAFRTWALLLDERLNPAVFTAPTTLASARKAEIAPYLTAMQHMFMAVEEQSGPMFRIGRAALSVTVEVYPYNTFTFTVLAQAEPSRWEIHANDLPLCEVQGEAELLLIVQRYFVFWLRVMVLGGNAMACQCDYIKVVVPQSRRIAKEVTQLEAELTELHALHHEGMVGQERTDWHRAQWRLVNEIDRLEVMRMSINRHINTQPPMLKTDTTPSTVRIVDGYGRITVDGRRYQLQRPHKLLKGSRVQVTGVGEFHVDCVDCESGDVLQGHLLAPGPNNYKTQSKPHGSESSDCAENSAAV